MPSNSQQRSVLPYRSQNLSKNLNNQFGDNSWENQETQFEGNETAEEDVYKS